MASDPTGPDLPVEGNKDEAIIDSEKHPNISAKPTWRTFFRAPKPKRTPLPTSEASSDGYEEIKRRPEKWSMGVLNDKETDEVPGSILLMSNAKRNEPLGLRNVPARTSASSLPSPYPPDARPAISRRLSEPNSVHEKKKTKDGTMILEPQPDDSMNDPLNWPALRRDVALLSLGFYCMLGGGMNPVLAAGFNDVAETYQVSVPQVALTTGLYMLGLGVGCVITSPTAILFGKRPVYLVCIVLFLISAVWCALSPNYHSLVVARIFMGLAVSPVECLPSATIAEIFFLHERAYRLGIYTLLLLSGKNLIPLISAAIIQGLHSWRWVFWMVAIVVGFCFFLMFFFVPETFWDRTPRPHEKSRKSTFKSISGFFHQPHHERKSKHSIEGDGDAETDQINPVTSLAPDVTAASTIAERRHQKHSQHVGFADDVVNEKGIKSTDPKEHRPQGTVNPARLELTTAETPDGAADRYREPTPYPGPVQDPSPSEDIDEARIEHQEPASARTLPGSTMTVPVTGGPSDHPPAPVAYRYTTHLRSQPPKTFMQTLKPWNGQLRHENWFLVALRPFILFAYPAILWSALVYSLSIGWLIVLSESVSEVYRTKDYNFSALGVGLVYISPFIGGILGTAVAGKVSDIIVRAMSRRNGGVYEPEFRLVMALPVAISTCIGLMGFGWSAEEKDNWIVPTAFFGIISFGSSLGSTTSITFAVDSYRMYAGEGLVTLNFSKNVFHGLVFSLFFNHWLEADGSKKVFQTIGGIQLACLLTTIPMYIYGKRARMWTYRKNLMEKF